MNRSLPAIVLFLLSVGIANGDGLYCPLEEWMSGPYSLYYCDYFPVECEVDGQADYWYGEPLENVPWQDCSDCVSQFTKAAKGQAQPKGQVFPGLARPVTASYKHVLPEGAGGETRRRSEAIDLDWNISFDVNGSPVYAKVFLLKVKQKSEPPQIRYVAMQVRQDQIDTAAAEPVAVAAIENNQYMYHGMFLGKRMLVLTAR